MQNYSEAVVLIKRLPVSDAEAKLEDRMSTVLSKLIVISKPHMINYMAKCSKTGTCHRGKQIHIHEWSWLGVGGLWHHKSRRLPVRHKSVVLSLSLWHRHNKDSLVRVPPHPHPHPFIRSTSSCGQVQRQSTFSLFQSLINSLCLFLSGSLLFLALFSLSLRFLLSFSKSPSLVSLNIVSSTWPG